MRHGHARPEPNARLKIFPPPIGPDSYAIVFFIVGRLQLLCPRCAGHVGLSHQHENAKLPALRNRRFATAHAVRLFEARRRPLGRFIRHEPASLNTRLSIALTRMRRLSPKNAQCETQRNDQEPINDMSPLRVRFLWLRSVPRLASERFSLHLGSPGRCAQGFWWIGLLPAHNWPVV